MLAPKKRKYRKDFRGKIRGKAIKGSSLAFGEYGLKSLSRSWVSAAQIEAARRAVSRSLRRGGKIWIRIFPDKPVTKRGAGVRMGGGKGDIDRYVAVVTPGRILFEVAGVTEDLVTEAFASASAKLPVKTKVVKKEESQ